MSITITQTISEHIRNCDVKFVHAKVSNVQDMVKGIFDNISNTSWIAQLEPIDRIAYEARAIKTINYIVEKVLNKIANTVTEELGELVVSTNAQDILETHHRHIKLPLAELWKEQVRGNPGFDFHTETPSNFVAFGEAKYNSANSSYGVALKQVVSFIHDRKDDKELSDLKHLISETTKANLLLPTARAYSVAFSIHPDNSMAVYNRIKRNKNFGKLLSYPELYLIGIQIVN